MEKVTGIMRQEEKSSREHLETVIESMSLEEIEWSISIAEEEEDQECGDVIFLIVMVYSRTSTSTLALLQQVYGCVCGVPCLILLMCTGNLSSVTIYFTLESEANEDPPEFTLTCQSRGGPVTEVEWRRHGVRVEEDSNHMTSQIIVDTSNNTVYNNTLRVRGRERGLYVCSISNNRHEYVQGASATGASATLRVGCELTWQTMKCHLLNSISVTQKPTSLNATYKTATSISLQWTFNITLSFDYSYVVYYQSRDGVSHSVAFTADSRYDVYTHDLTGLPAGRIQSISLVALVHLPSPVVGPVTPGKYIVANHAFHNSLDIQLLKLQWW